MCFHILFALYISEVSLVSSSLPLTPFRGPSPLPLGKATGGRALLGMGVGGGLLHQMQPPQDIVQISNDHQQEEDADAGVFCINHEFLTGFTTENYLVE